MFDTSAADLVFLVCALVGGGLLLITVLLDDILGGLLEAFDFDLGGSSLMPILLAFVAMFGIGGLFGTQVLDLSAGMASVVGVIAGLGGGALAWAMFRFLYSSADRAALLAGGPHRPRRLCLGRHPQHRLGDDLDGGRGHDPGVPRDIVGGHPAG